MRTLPLPAAECKVMITVINIVVMVMVVNNVMVMVINIPPYAHPGPQSLGTGKWYVTHPSPALGVFWPACIAGQGIRWTAGLRARTAAAGRYGARVQGSGSTHPTMAGCPAVDGHLQNGDIWPGTQQMRAFVKQNSNTSL